MALITVPRVLAVLGVTFVGLQLVPYGRAHTNPPERVEPAWDSPATRALAVRACFDCHSNETVWPWYSHVAPLSWSVQEHVDEGREKLNFSTWNRPQEEAEEVGEVIEEGEMPLDNYLWIHPEAKLTDAEKRQLVAGLTRTVQASPPPGGGGEGGEEDDD